MTSRMQISMTRELQRRARDRAVQLGVSFVEYVRRLIERDLGEPPRRVEPSQVFDLGRSGGADIAREKDAMVGRAVAAGAARRGGRGKR
jgi:hypothetical protein